MPGPRPQIGIAQAVQEVVGPLQRVGDAKLGLQDPDHVPAAERANAIRRPGLGVQPRAQPVFVRARQTRGLARPWTVPQAGESVVPVPIHPVLHKAAAAAQPIADGHRFKAAQRQQHAPIAFA